MIGVISWKIVDAVSQLQSHKRLSLEDVYFSDFVILRLGQDTCTPFFKESPTSNQTLLQSDSNISKSSTACLPIPQSESCHIPHVQAFKKATIPGEVIK
jgi:hypothetical protein